MKRLFIALTVLILYHNQGWCAPAITGFTGTVAHSEEIVISGTGFLTKSPAAPLVWDNCSGTSLATKWDRYLPTQAATTYNMAYRNSGFRNVTAPHSFVNRFISGGHAQGGYPPTWNSFAGPVVLVGKDYASGTNNFYISYYYRLDPLWPPRNGESVNSDVNHKTILLSPNTGSSLDTGTYFGFNPHPELMEGGHYGMKGDYLLCESNYSCEYYGWCKTTDLMANWVKHEVVGVDINNATAGKMYYYQDNYLLASGENCDCYRGTGTSLKSMAIGYYWTRNNTSVLGSNDAFRYYADLYMDVTPSRVMLGNASTYAACTIIEPQIPTAWSNTEITATVNLARMPSGVGYLYVVDSTNAKSPGYSTGAITTTTTSIIATTTVPLTTSTVSTPATTSISTWDYEENFETLVIGNLSGQDDWFDSDGNDTSPQVQNTVAYSGTKGIAITLATSDQFAQVSRPAGASFQKGTVYFAIMTDVLNMGLSRINLIQVAPSINHLISMSEGKSDNELSLYYQTVGDAVKKATIVSTIVPNIWYAIGFEWDVSRGIYGQYRYNLNGGAWSGWYDESVQLTGMNYIQVLSMGDNEGTNKFYFDNLKTSPFIPSTTTTSLYATTSVEVTTTILPATYGDHAVYIFDADHGGSANYSGSSATPECYCDGYTDGTNAIFISSAGHFNNDYTGHYINIRDRGIFRIDGTILGESTMQINLNGTPEIGEDLCYCIGGAYPNLTILASPSTFTSTTLPSTSTTTSILTTSSTSSSTSSTTTAPASTTTTAVSSEGFVGNKCPSHSVTVDGLSNLTDDSGWITATATDGGAVSFMHIWQDSYWYTSNASFKMELWENTGSWVRIAQTDCFLPGTNGTQLNVALDSATSITEGNTYALVISSIDTYYVIGASAGGVTNKDTSHFTESGFCANDGAALADDGDWSPIRTICMHADNSAT